MWHTSTWAICAPPATWRRVLRTMFWQYDRNTKSHCAPAQRFCVLAWSFGVRRRHLEARFHGFCKSPRRIQAHSETIQGVSYDSQTSPGCPLINSGNIHFSSFPWFWNPRSRSSIEVFCDLEATNGTHGLLTCCSSFPRWDFDSGGHMIMW